jgi:hypothetical protein
MKQYLHAAIAEDNTSGAEYFLASIVQDAVIHECYLTEDHNHLSSMAHRAARLALNAVNESMGLNSFIICETVRGVIHGLVSLGADPVSITREVIRGICMESAKSNVSYEDVTRGITVGVKMTARDLGIDPESLTFLIDSEIKDAWDHPSNHSPTGISGLDTYEEVSVAEQSDLDVDLPDYQLELEIEATINKTLAQRKKRPYIKYKHGRLR